MTKQTTHTTTKERAFSLHCSAGRWGTRIWSPPAVGTAAGGAVLHQQPAQVGVRPQICRVPVGGALPAGQHGAVSDQPWLQTGAAQCRSLCLFRTGTASWYWPWKWNSHFTVLSRKHRWGLWVSTGCLVALVIMLPTEALPCVMPVLPYCQRHKALDGVQSQRLPSPNLEPLFFPSVVATPPGTAQNLPILGVPSRQSY